MQNAGEPGGGTGLHDGDLLVLGMDAATPPASVALVRGEVVLQQRTGPFGPQTDAWILAAVQTMLDAEQVTIADLDLIAAGRGPGTFTGIRVALAAALGLSAGSDVPVCGIGTLQALAEGAQAATGRTERLDVLALIDARRQQHYVLRAAVDPQPTIIQAVTGPAAIDTTALLARMEADAPTLAVGATEALPDTVRRVEGPPLAVSIGRLAARIDSASRPPATPSYLRAADAVPGRSPLRRRPL